MKVEPPEVKRTREGGRGERRAIERKVVMEERHRPWQVEDREKPVTITQVKYTWETSIPTSWKKIKGERHFQRHMTKLRVHNSYDILPSLEQTLLVPPQSTLQSPIRLRKKAANQEDRVKGKIVGEGEDSVSDTDRPYIGSLVLVTREESPREDLVHMSENPSKRDISKPSSIALSPQKLPPVFRSTSTAAKEWDLSALSKTALRPSPSQALLKRQAKKYSKVVISNPKVEDFLSRFERREEAKVAKEGRKGWRGQKLPWSKQRDLNWEHEGEEKGGKELLGTLLKPRY